MLIYHAILGILSFKPFTGYDLKRIMQDSPFMYWSGNNNQIYKALVELHNERLVTSEVQHQDNSPTKKVYTITDAGLSELKKWSLSLPEAPETKKSFLIQLAWAGQLSDIELDSLLTQYEYEINMQIILERERQRKCHFAPNRTPRETAVWNLIYDNIMGMYTNELNWINQIRQAVIDSANRGEFAESEIDNKLQPDNKKEENEMNYRLIEKDNQKYVMLPSEGKQLQSEQDGIELISICASEGVTRLLIHAERLSDDFLRLRTGVAGAILQKFANYNIKAVVILKNDSVQGKFKDFLTESNKGNMFRSYNDINFDEAEKWLLI